jgi:hypothetical protein
MKEREQSRYTETELRLPSDKTICETEEEERESPFSEQFGYN